MFVEAFEWDERNIEHIACHQVSQDEVEEVFLGVTHYRKTAGGKYLVLGQTFDGRHLFVVFVKKGTSIIRPITARDMNLREARNLE